jgi:hypothetical protein
MTRTAPPKGAVLHCYVSGALNLICSNTEQYQCFQSVLLTHTATKGHSEMALPTSARRDPLTIAAAKESLQTFAIISQTVASLPFAFFTCGTVKNVLSHGLGNSCHFADVSCPRLQRPRSFATKRFRQSRFSSCTALRNGSHLSDERPVERVSSIGICIYSVLSRKTCVTRPPNTV